MNRAAAVGLARTARANLDAAERKGIPAELGPIFTQADADLGNWETFLAHDAPDELGVLPFLPILWAASAAAAMIGLYRLVQVSADIREAVGASTRSAFDAGSKIVVYGIVGLLGVGLYKLGSRKPRPPTRAPRTVQRTVTTVRSEPQD